MKTEIKKLRVLKNKYLKAYNLLCKFTDHVVDSLDCEKELRLTDIRESPEFFDCEVTLMVKIENKLAALEAKLEDAEACALTGLEA